MCFVIIYIYILKLVGVSHGEHPPLSPAEKDARNQKDYRRGLCPIRPHQPPTRSPPWKFSDYSVSLPPGGTVEHEEDAGAEHDEAGAEPPRVAQQRQVDHLL